MPEVTVRSRKSVGAITPRSRPSVVNIPPLLSSSEILELSRLDAVISLQRWWKHRRRHNHKRVVELTEHLRVYAESLIQKKRQARIRAKIRDIFVHVMFLLVYTVSCHGGYTSEHLYRLVHATTREYRERSFDPQSVRSFDTIASPTDLYAWLRGPFLSVTYSSAWAETTNHIVGGIRIGQLRVARANCTLRLASYAPAALMDDTGVKHDVDCYGSSWGDFTSDDESKDAFGGDGTAFHFEGVNGTSTTKERSEFLSSMKASNTKSLPSPAFSVVLPRANRTHAVEILDFLESNAYVDAQTRAVMIDINWFNIMLQYTMALRFLIEFASSGAAVATIHTSSAPFSKSFLIHSDETWWTACNILVLIFYAYFLLSEIALQSIRRHRRRALPSSSGRALRWSSRNGSLLRVLSLGLYFTVWVLRLFTLLKAPSSFPLFKSSVYVRLRPFAEAFRLSQYLLGLNTCLCWWMQILLLRVVTHVDVFVRTAEIAAPKLLTLLLCLAVLLYGYASAFLVVSGAESMEFRSIPQAMTTLLLLLFGSSDIATTSTSSTMEVILFACFLLLNVFVISNLFLAVVYDSYRQALDQAEQLRNSNDQFNLPLETFNYCRAVVDQIVEKVREVIRWLFPARKLPLSDKLKRFSVVHAVSSQVLTKSTKLISEKAEELSRLGDKLVHNVAAGLGDGNRDLLIEQGENKQQLELQRNGAGYQRTLLSSGRGQDQSVKLLQGMMLQLAIQNETLQRSVDELRRELKHQSGGGNTDVVVTGTVTSRQTGRTISNSQMRVRTFAPNRLDSEEDDDGDDDIGDGEEVHVVDTPGELTRVQSIYE